MGTMTTKEAQSSIMTRWSQTTWTSFLNCPWSPTGRRTSQMLLMTPRKDVKAYFRMLSPSVTPTRILTCLTLTSLVLRYAITSVTPEVQQLLAAWFRKWEETKSCKYTNKLPAVGSRCRFCTEVVTKHPAQVSWSQALSSMDVGISPLHVALLYPWIWSNKLNKC